MKRTFYIAVLVLLQTAVLASNVPLANNNLQGLRANSIQDVLNLEPNQIDLATAAIIVSRQWNEIVHGDKYLKKLDDMALELRKRIEQSKKDNIHPIDVINNYLFKELGLKSVADADNPDDLLLHSVLDRRQGYCLSLSVLYLSLGERLGLPLYGVVVPGHFFVRYDDGHVRFNIETTCSGAIVADDYYIDKYKIFTDDNDSIYMLNLNKLGTLGCFFNNLGNSYSSVGNTEKAKIALERAVDIIPKLAAAQTNLGNIYLHQKLYDNAIYQYRKSLRIDPNDAKTHNNLANAYMEKNMLDQAISSYKLAIELKPDLSHAYENLAKAYISCEMFEPAEQILKDALRLMPTKPTLYARLGTVYSRKGDYENAQKQFTRALTLDPLTAEAHYGMGTCYESSNQIEKEISAYKKALMIEPDMIAALINLGKAYFTKNDYENAADQYKKALEIEPENSNIFFNIAAAYFNMADFAHAVEAFNSLLRIDPNQPETHKSLAYSYYYLKDYQTAWKHLKIAENAGIKIDPALTEAINKELR